MSIPTREAIVLVAPDRVNFVPALEIDPIDLPIDTDGLADVFDSALAHLMDAILTMETMETGSEYRLVWSDDRTPVKGTCPVCDGFFIVSEGAPGDELNEGYDAVFCGCDPRDD